MKVGLKLTFFLLLSTACITALFYTVESRRQGRYLDTLAREHNEVVRDSFDQLKKDDLRMLSAALKVIVQDAAIKKLFLQGDRQSLYAHTAPLFNNLRQGEGITHFYFILPDGHVYLRMHHPELRGDLVKRKSFLEAQKTQRISWEMELGKTAFALRVVMPYYEKDRLIGYVELAEEIDHFLSTLRQTTASEFALVGKKEFLDAVDWQSVKTVAGERNNWNDMKEHVVLSSTTDSGAALNCFTEENLARIEGGQTTFPLFRQAKRTYLCTGFDIRNAEGRQIGAVLTLTDFSKQMAIYRQRNEAIAYMSALLFCAIFLSGLIGSRWITRPVMKIARACKAAGEGDLDQRLDISSKDEFGYLAKTFNSMIERRSEAEAALKASEEKYRDLFEKANDAIFLVDASLKYVDVNQRASELFGFSREEFLRMSILDLIPPEQRPRSEKEFDRIRANRPYEKFVGKLRTKDGRWLDIEVSSSPIFVDGKVVGSRDIVRDISDRKLWEEELVKREKLESLGVLAGGLAHDFNNLLTSMLGNISMAKLYATEDPQKLKKLLDEAESACLRTKDLTHQLLTFSRGGAPIRKAVNLGELIRQSVEFSLHGSNAKSSYDIPEDLWTVSVDAAQISQVINNLIINADQAMPDGGTLTVCCENLVLPESNPFSLEPGKYVKVTITDTGLGIDEENLPKIFDPYFTTKSSGSGLGLANVYSIIRRHNGHVRVQSTLGKGTSFHLYLTALDREQAVPEVKDEKVPAAGAGKILLMDDEKMVCAVAGEMLRHLGFEVKCTRDGREAINVYQAALEEEKPFQVVIMDLTIPGGMGGKEAIAELRRIDPQVRAIVSSGYSQDPIMGNFRAYGFRGVVAKPYSMQELAKAISKVFSAPGKASA